MSNLAVRTWTREEFQRAAVNSTSSAPAPANDTSQTPSEASSDLTQSAATGLLINGSVNNGAASAFSQMAAFGNNRRGPGSLYNGGLGVIFDTSAWDAASLSLGGRKADGAPWRLDRGGKHCTTACLAWCETWFRP